MEYIKLQWSVLAQAYKVSKSDFKVLLSYLGVFSLFVLPIIIANEYYRDDLTRVLSGAYGWSSLGRPLANYGLQFVSGSTFSAVIDTAPLTQIICIILLGFAAFFLHRHFLQQFKFSAFLVVLLPFLNPFLLTNLSYRLDSVGMILGVLMVSMAIRAPKSHFGLSFYSVGFLFLSLTAYQPITHFFIAIIGLEVIFNFNLHRKLQSAVMSLVGRLGEFLLAYVVYLFTIGLIATTNRKSIIGLDAQFFERVWDNAQSFMNTSTLAYHTQFGIMVLTLVAIVSGLSFLFLLFKQQQQRICWLAIIILAVGLFVSSLFGPMILLENAVVDFRVIPSSFFLFPILISIAAIGYRKLQWLALLPIIFSISVSFQYGNAMNNQRDFERMVVGRISDVMLANDTGKEIFSFGKVAYAPWTNIAVSNSPLVKSLVDENVAENWILTGLLRQQGVENAVWLWSTQRRQIIDGLTAELCEEVTLMASDRYFSIYSAIDKIFVVLKPSTSRRQLCEN